MFRPVGSQPPSVYWRRRLIVIGSLVLLVVLLVLTINAVRSGGDGKASANSPSTPATSPAATPGSSASTSSSAASSTASSPAPNRSSSSSTAKGRTSSSVSSSAPAAPSSTPAPQCVVKDLQLRALSQKSSYKVGDSLVLQLQVTNPSAGPCVQNLADKQIELRVYNGESRVWGSHDCTIEPGTTERTLASKTAVVVSVEWGGLTSRPGCTGMRQRIGAGTYTLYASLAGVQGHASQFSIS